MYSATDIEYASDEANNWSCPPCLEHFFPFHCIDYNTSILEVINNPVNVTFDLETLESMVFDPLNLNDNDSEGILSDLDPDQNFINEIRNTPIHNCKYHYSSSILTRPNGINTNEQISIFHLNIRSIPKNLNMLIPTLHSSGLTFDVLGFTETWLRPNNADCFGIPGYTHTFLTRPTQSGWGGLAFHN
jgi:hypothetical protein